MLIETARFQASRVYFNPRINKYVLNSVKGPNEYDGVVNNNTYTNWCARWNLAKAVEMLEKAQKLNPEKYGKVTEKTSFKTEEITQWKDIIERMYINYDTAQDLYVEDDSILDKKPVDLKKLRPGKRISTEMGWTWDTIISHRVVKQADVLLLMTIHRKNFTLQQLKNAWNFYEPLTLHDSSLSYNTHSIVAAELGLKEKSYDYYQQTVRLDIDDLMENSFLGIHAANAGGSWQCVVNGFCGMKNTDTGLEFDSRFPDKSWEQVQFKIIYQGVVFQITATKDHIQIERLKELHKSGIPLKIENNKIIRSNI
jgi:trehalose/maltose hydrolase-like predicted phosphorylase